MRRVFAIIALLLGLCAALTAAVRQVTFISDIHYDPQYGTASAFSKCTTSASSVWGVAGCDASPQLTQRSLDDVSAQNTSFIFFGGDWQRHGYARSGLAPAALFTDLSERFRNVTVDGSLGEVAFVGSLGNNDVVPDYYFAWESAASEEQLAYRVQAMEAAGLVNAAEASVLTKCGYYTHEMETLNVIVLHTLLWAYRLEPSLTSSMSDPCDQFSFLEGELQKTSDAGKRAVIVGHIPPGLNTYTVLSSGFTTPEADLYWKPYYQAAYDAIISSYRDVVAVQLFGHIHKFVLQGFASNGALSLIIPAISPIFLNDPAYLLANFSDEGWVLEDVQIRYLTPDGEFHAGLSAQGALGSKAPLASLPELRASIRALATKDEAWAEFLTMYCGGETHLEVFPNGACDTHCRHVLVCSMLENGHEAIQQCVRDFADSSSAVDPQRTSPGVVVLVVVCSLLVLGLAAVLVLMGRSGQTTPTCAELQSLEWWRTLVKGRATTPVVIETELLTGRGRGREESG